jgi:hypothetical protein
MKLVVGAALGRAGATAMLCRKFLVLLLLLLLLLLIMMVLMTDGDEMIGGEWK